MFHRAATAAFLCLTTATAGAALIGRAPVTPGGNDYRVVYDTDRNVTWLADANAGAGTTFDDGWSSTDGGMTWSSAQAWIASLNSANFLGVNNWRLPVTAQPDATCNGQDYYSGYPPQGFGYNCAASEMAHLFYGEIGGVAGRYISEVHNDNFALFRNVQDNQYWSATVFGPDPVNAWVFTFGIGFQYRLSFGNEIYAWAVRDGDLAPVPLPAVGWLLAPSLGAIRFARRRPR
jgi:hypothetical protein